MTAAAILALAGAAPRALAARRRRASAYCGVDSPGARGAHSQSMARSVQLLIAACLLWAGLVGATADSRGLSAGEAGGRIGVGVAVIVFVWVVGSIAVTAIRR